MPIPSSNVPTIEEQEHERSLRAPDPRAFDERYQPRISLYEDDSVTLTELGAEQELFIEPEGK